MKLSLPTDRCPNALSYIIILLTVTAYGVLNNVVFSVLPLLGKEFGLTAAQITAMGAAAAMLVFLVSPWWGRQSDISGRKRSILIGVGGFCASGGLLIVCFTLAEYKILNEQWLYYCLFAARMLQAFLIAAMLPAITAYIIDITSDSERAVGLSHIGAAHGIGSIAGPSLVAIAVWGLLLPLYAAVALGVLMGVLVARFVVEPGRAKAPVAAGKPKKLSYFDGRYWRLLVVGTVLYMGMAVTTQLMGFYVPTILGLTSAQAAIPLGIVLGVMAVATVFGQLFLVARLGWPALKLLTVGIPTMAVGSFIIYLASDTLLMSIGTLLVGLGLGIGGPGFSAAMSFSVEAHEQGAAAGFLSACPALGFVIGPLIAGFMFNSFPRLPYLLMAICLLLVIPLILKQSRLVVSKE